MKAKKIGVVYTGNFSNLGAVEKVFNDIVSELEEEGRSLRYINNEFAVFEDGSRVLKIKSLTLIGRRLTHLFIDESISAFSNGEEIIREALLPCVVAKGDYEHIEAIEDVKDRVFLFNKDGDKKRLLGE